jgi:phosphatidylglycerol lysyltransferase
VLDRLGAMIEPLYGFTSLHRFKQKFNPRSESLSLLYRDEGDLPRIAIALTRAYLPDATMRDLVASASTSSTGKN